MQRMIVASGVLLGVLGICGCSSDLTESSAKEAFQKFENSLAYPGGDTTEVISCQHVVMVTGTQASAECTYRSTPGENVRHIPGHQNPTIRTGEPGFSKDTNGAWLVSGCSGC